VDKLAKFVMWWGICGLLICGLIVGKKRFNRIMDDIFDPPASRAK